MCCQFLITGQKNAINTEWCTPIFLISRSEYLQRKSSREAALNPCSSIKKMRKTTQRGISSQINMGKSRLLRDFHNLVFLLKSSMHIHLIFYQEYYVSTLLAKILVHSMADQHKLGHFSSSIQSQKINFVYK